MTNNPLQVTSVANNSNSPNHHSSNRHSRRQEIQATMERMWLQNPEQFNPERDCVQRKRLEQTLQLINDHLTLKDLKITDLGCGAGVFSRKLRDQGARIDAVDIAGNALIRLEEHNMENINPIQDCLPTTNLKDDFYDLVVCTEVIGYLPQDTYRLLFAELCRIVKPKGHVVCSTALDLNSDDALQRFAGLAETEFSIDSWALSYHRLFVKLCHFFDLPRNYVKAYRDHEIREKESKAKKTKLGHAWYNLNTSLPLVLVWQVLSFVTNPIHDWLNQNESVMNLCDKICKFLWSDAGISHAIFIGKRRPLSTPLPADEIPIERPKKRQVWE